eukprot:TRINITY_DN27152_c0_g1_i2.p2 TRINITY_DN27152_c0_g1~~TRINITY_DN27152_c0_g1_i2.p2  ORF type:complete len:447 (+),score=123.81 TRINITY_DN27152_c0_g1_i2:66-1343(+)
MEADDAPVRRVLRDAAAAARARKPRPTRQCGQPLPRHPGAAAALAAAAAAGGPAPAPRPAPPAARPAVPLPSEVVIDMLSYEHLVDVAVTHGLDPGSADAAHIRLMLRRAAREAPTQERAQEWAAALRRCAVSAQGEQLDAALAGLRPHEPDLKPHELLRRCVERWNAQLALKDLSRASDLHAPRLRAEILEGARAQLRCVSEGRQPPSRLPTGWGTASVRDQAAECRWRSAAAQALADRALAPPSPGGQLLPAAALAAAALPATCARLEALPEHADLAPLSAESSGAEQGGPDCAPRRARSGGARRLRRRGRRSAGRRGRARTQPPANPGLAVFGHDCSKALRAPPRRLALAPPPAFLIPLGGELRQLRGAASEAVGADPGRSPSSPQTAGACALREAMARTRAALDSAKGLLERAPDPAPAEQ